MSRLSAGSIRIRPATPADLDRLVEFNAALARETESRELDLVILRRGIDRLLADPDRGRYLVAERADDSDVLGCLMVTREWSDWRDGWFWWIQSVYVAESARGHGVYRALHERVREIASTEPDVVGLRLYVERENARAQATYRSLGMHETGYRLFEELLPGAAKDAEAKTFS